MSFRDVMDRVRAMTQSLPRDSKRRLVWFSCGAASAVAAKVAVDTYGDQATVVYCDTSASEHPDNLRFLHDVEKWIGREVVMLRSPKYATIDEVFEKRRFMSGRSGAICTTEMKKFVREAYQRIDDIHIFGYTSDEQRRADQFEDRNPSLMVEWILIDREIDKDECKARIQAAGIKLPVMYDLGFEHNNCIGCVKSGSPGYWNKTRRLFPEVFERRARQSREIGARLVVIRGVRHFLDELPPEEYAPDDDIDCGPVCQVPVTEE